MGSQGPKGTPGRFGLDGQQGFSGNEVY
jgi:hypothetical protein